MATTQQMSELQQIAVHLSTREFLAALLTAAIAKTGGPSALGRAIGWDKANVSRVQAGERISPFRASQLVAVLELEPLAKVQRLAVVAALAEQSKTDQERSFWQSAWTAEFAHGETSDSETPDASLVATIVDGFNLSKTEAAALLKMTTADFSLVVAGKRSLSLSERLRAIDRAGAVHIRRAVSKVLPAALAERLDRWVIAEVRRDAGRQALKPG